MKRSECYHNSNAAENKPQRLYNSYTVKHLEPDQQGHKGRIRDRSFENQSVFLSSMTESPALQTEQYNDKETKDNAFILIFLVRSMNFMSK